MADIRHRLIPEDELHNPKGFTPAVNSSVATRDELGQSRYEKQVILPEAQFVDGNSAPPSTVLNDTFVIFDGGGGVVDAGWSGASFNDWVRYDGAEFQALTPTDQLIYDTTNSVYKNFNGSAWVEFGAGAAILNVTTAEKAGLTPTEGDFVYDTDLDSLQRYDGSAWVDLAKGYGVIEVITDSVSGVPTYYTDLQTALETCKTSGSNNIVKLHSDISLSAQIDINQSGTGTGNGYNFNSLTIDFNGFEVSFDDAGTTDAFNISFVNSAASNQKIIFLNGKVSRTSGTGTHYALNFPSSGFGDIIMSNMYWYCQNGGGAYILATTPSAKNITHNFGDSLFVSESATAALYIGASTASNFKARNTSSGAGLGDNGSNMLMNFEAYSDSGDAAFIRAGDALNFYCYSNSGTALNLDNDSTIKRCSYFTAESNSGYAIFAQSNSDRLSHFNAYSNSSTYACWFVSGVEAQYGNILSNSGYGAFCVSSVFKHCNFTSLSGTAGAYIRDNNVLEHCNFEGKGGYGLFVADFGGNNNSVLTHCNIYSSYNNAAGHAANIDLGGGNVYFKNCTFDVVNTSANCLYATSAQTVNIGNSGYGTATTPVNANVTEAITTAPNANGNYTI